MAINKSDSLKAGGPFPIVRESAIHVGILTGAALFALDPATWIGCVFRVSDSAPAGQLYYSDGSNWMPDPLPPAWGRTVFDVAARDAIDAGELQPGMLVYTYSENTTWQLGTDGVTWAAFGGGGGSVTWADIGDAPSDSGSNDLMIAPSAQDDPGEVGNDAVVSGGAPGAGAGGDGGGFIGRGHAGSSVASGVGGVGGVGEVFGSTGGASTNGTGGRGGKAGVYAGNGGATTSGTAGAGEDAELVGGGPGSGGSNPADAGNVVLRTQAGAHGGADGVVQLQRNAARDTEIGIAGGKLTLGAALMLETAAVASASSISIDTPAVVLSGSAAVATITPAKGAASGRVQSLILVAAAGSTWSLTTGGNIVLPRGDVTPTAGEALVLVQDAAGNWHVINQGKVDPNGITTAAVTSGAGKSDLILTATDANKGVNLVSQSGLGIVSTNDSVGSKMQYGGNVFLVMDTVSHALQGKPGNSAGSRVLTVQQYNVTDAAGAMAAAHYYGSQVRSHLFGLLSGPAGCDVAGHGEELYAVGAITAGDLVVWVAGASAAKHGRSVSTSTAAANLTTWAGVAVNSASDGAMVRVISLAGTRVVVTCETSADTVGAMVSSSGSTAGRVTKNASPVVGGLVGKITAEAGSTVNGATLGANQCVVQLQ